MEANEDRRERMPTPSQSQMRERVEEITNAPNAHTTHTHFAITGGGNNDVDDDDGAATVQESLGTSKKRTREGTMTDPVWIRLKAWEHDAISTYLKGTHIGCKLRITIGSQESNAEETIEGIVIKKDPLHVTITYKDRTMMLPPDDDPSVLITNIAAIRTEGTSDLIPHLTDFLRPINDVTPTYVIFCDGGTIPSAQGAAAIACFHTSTRSVEWHSQYYSATTTPITEAVAFVAALRLAVKKKETTLVITDALNNLEWLRGKQAVSKAARHLSTLVQLARDIYSQAPAMLNVAHMWRRNKNRADEYVRSTRLAGTGHGDTTLFPEAPSYTPPPAKTQPTTVEMEFASWEKMTPPATLQEYASERWRTARRCPENGRQGWALLVKRAINNVITSTGDTRNNAMRILLKLPSIFLPSNASGRRIVNHLERQQAFGISTGAVNGSASVTHDNRNENNCEETNNNGTGIVPETTIIPTRTPAASGGPVTLDQRSEGRRNNNNNNNNNVHDDDDNDDVQETGNFTELANQVPSNLTRQAAKDRMSTMVERLARDFKIRRAVKVLHQEYKKLEGEETEQNPDERLRLIQGKLEPGRGTMTPVTTHSTAIFAPPTVLEALRRVPKDTATGVDAWEIHHLNDAVSSLRDLATDIGILLALINDAAFDETTMEMISCSRVVGIPKDGGGIRPICVPSIWVKLLGAAIIARNGIKNGRHQYGCGRKAGAVDVIHRTRRDYNNGQAVAKLDLENAFNAVSRVCIAILVEKYSANDTKKYFTTMYGKPNKLIFYDGRSPTILAQHEGVRQGDALSTHLFALVMDAIADMAVQKLPILENGLRMYIDDITIAVPGEHAAAAVTVVAECIQTWKLRVNMQKSRIISRSPVLCPIPPANMNEPFMMLGACLINHVNSSEPTKKKCQFFFDAMNNLNVHPQLVVTLLRLSGVHKAKYYLTNHSPTIGEPVATWFDTNVKSILHKAIGFLPPEEMIHDRAGLGIPRYAGNCHLLYDAAEQAMRADTERVEIPLVTNQFQTVEYTAQVTAGWLFYRAQQALSPAQYAAAIRIRCRCTGTALPMRCACEKTVLTCEDELVQHLYRCQHASRFTATNRHNLLRDEIARTCRRYGLSTTLEPRFFVYPDNKLKRPDLIVNTSKPIVTDFTIVNSEYQVGVTSDRAAQEKIRTHRNVVQMSGHIFIPFAMETHGHYDESCVNWCNAVSQELHPTLRGKFLGDILYTAQVALAKGRAMTLMAMNHESLGFEFDQD